MQINNYYEVIISIRSSILMSKANTFDAKNWIVLYNVHSHNSIWIFDKKTENILPYQMYDTLKVQLEMR